MRGFKAAILSLLLSTALSGCLMPPFNFVLTDDGQSVRMSTILSILSDSNLSEEQQKEELRNLGIVNEELINLLITQLGQ
ncbi:MAG: hypothetical protein ACYTF1_06750 [Planctomycetota bacterium]|jgi:hypothetical protein